MRKFVVYSVKGLPIIMEIECEQVTPMHDPSILWSVKPGEYRARILAPKNFTEKDGKPAVWCSFAIYDTLEIAKEMNEKLTREGFDFNLRKYGTAFTEEDVQAAVAAVQVMML